MKKTALILSFILTLTLCACSDGGSDSDTPAATSAPDTVVSSKEENSSEKEISSQQETPKDESSLSDEEFDRLANYFEEFDSTNDFLDSDFINEYYGDVDFSTDKIVPVHDGDVISGNVNAFYSCYYIYYSYKDKNYGICVSTHYNKFDTVNHTYTDYESVQDLYKELSQKSASGTEYTFDKENDLIAVKIGYSGNEYIQKVTPSGKQYDVFCFPDNSATLDEIIEFSKHIKF